MEMHIQGFHKLTIPRFRDHNDGEEVQQFPLFLASLWVVLEAQTATVVYRKRVLLNFRWHYLLS